MPTPSIRRRDACTTPSGWDDRLLIGCGKRGGGRQRRNRLTGRAILLDEGADEKFRRSLRRDDREGIIGNLVVIAANGG